MMGDKINLRYFKWANKVLDLVDNMEAKISLHVICKQIAAANYRASGRAKDMKNRLIHDF